MRQALSSIVLGLALTMMSTPVLAATAPDAPKGVVDGCDFGTGKVGVECVNIVIANAIKILFSFAGTLCLLMIIIAGYQIALGAVTGSGDTGGKERLKWALLGFFLVAFTFGIINAALSAIS